MLEYNEQTENLMEIAMMLEQLKGESEYLFETLTDIESITWKQKFVDWANEFAETYEPNKDVWPGNYLEVIEGFAREKILEFAGVEEKKIVVYVLHGFWENEFTNGCAVVDVSIDLEAVMKKLDEIIESKAREHVKVQEDKAEEERGLRYFEIWDENGQGAKFYIVEQYLELSQNMMEAIAESLAKGAGK